MIVLRVVSLRLETSQFPKFRISLSRLLMFFSEAGCQENCPFAIVQAERLIAISHYVSLGGDRGQLISLLNCGRVQAVVSQENPY